MHPTTRHEQVEGIANRARRLIAAQGESPMRVRSGMNVDTAIYVASLVSELDRMVGFMENEEPAPEPTPVIDANGSAERRALAHWREYQTLRHERERSVGT